MRKLVARLMAVMLAMAWGSAGAEVPCVLVGDVCVDGPSTKVINGLSIYKDCWQYQETYECGGLAPLADDCANLRAQGCYQTGSACETYSSTGTCDIYRQTYACQAPATTTTVVQCGSDMFCSQGGCWDTTYPGNTDLTQSYGGLAAIQDAAKQFDSLDMIVFKGTALQCTYYRLNAKDCCDFNGILNKVPLLDSCSATEKQLAQARSDRVTVSLGRYCSRRVLRACVEYKETHCVFGSVLARILMVAAHQQLNIPWGDAQNPNCAGITPEQFASLDFNAIDFSEFTNSFAMPAADPSALLTSLQQRIQGAAP